MTFTPHSHSNFRFCRSVRFGSRQPSFVAGGFDQVAGRFQLRLRGVRVNVSKGHAHVTRSPLGKGQAKHPNQCLRLGCALPVFDFQVQQQLTVTIEKPRVRKPDVVLRYDSPQLGQCILIAGPPLSLTELSTKSDGLARMTTRFDNR